VPDGAGMAAAVRAMGEAAGVVERVEVGPAEAHWVGKATDGAARKDQVEAAAAAVPMEQAPAAATRAAAAASAVAVATSTGRQIECSSEYSCSRRQSSQHPQRLGDSRRPMPRRSWDTGRQCYHTPTSTLGLRSRRRVERERQVPAVRVAMVAMAVAMAVAAKAPAAVAEAEAGWEMSAAAVEEAREAGSRNSNPIPWYRLKDRGSRRFAPSCSRHGRQHSQVMALVECGAVDWMAGAAGGQGMRAEGAVVGEMEVGGWATDGTAMEGKVLAVEGRVQVAMGRAVTREAAGAATAAVWAVAEGAGWVEWAATMAVAEEAMAAAAKATVDAEVSEVPRAASRVMARRAMADAATERPAVAEATPGSCST